MSENLSTPVRSHTVGAMSTQDERPRAPTLAAPTTPAPAAQRPTAPVPVSDSLTEAQRRENERKRQQQSVQATQAARPGEQRPPEPGTQVRDAVTGQMINQPAVIDAVTGAGRT